jgi:negative regulator of sigma E activity
LTERLSAFLDGEANATEARELLDQLCRDPQLRDTLYRHQRTRAALRGELHPGLDDGFAGRVMAAIEQESRPRERVWLATLRRNRPVQAVAGLAMAASLAAVTVLSVRTLLPASDTAFPALVAKPEARHTAAATAVSAPSRQWSELSPDAMAELDSYLMSHNNSAVDHGLNGSLGFMRVAAHEGAEFAE